jgi:hypothetical protein
MGLNVTKLPQDASTCGALARLGVCTSRKIAQAEHSTASSALKYSRKGFESYYCRSTDHVETPVGSLTWVRKTAAKRIIRPLKQKVRNSIKYRILVDLFLLEFYPVYFAEPVLIVFENSTREKLIKNLSLSPSERH